MALRFCCRRIISIKCKACAIGWRSSIAGALHYRAASQTSHGGYSAAVTLSDMEIFVFPEIMFSLVLANIMSPRIWAWREHEWFRDIGKLKPYRRVLRLKQFIIDNYEFNLDLDTWGLTEKAREVARFAPFMDEGTIGRSNALFGYEGDKYYFSQDIRKHFGLDKYTTETIPFWKTETVEASHSPTAASRSA